MVLLDLMLPEADGFELCRQIRERSPSRSSSCRPGRRARQGHRAEHRRRRLHAQASASSSSSPGSSPPCAEPAPPQATPGRPHRRHHRRADHQPGQRPVHLAGASPPPPASSPCCASSPPPRQLCPAPTCSAGLGTGYETRPVRPRLRRPPARQLNHPAAPPSSSPTRRGYRMAGNGNGVPCAGGPADFERSCAPRLPLRVTMRPPAVRATFNSRPRRVLTNFKAFGA